MTNLIHGFKNHIFTITLNRVEKHNAFDDTLIKDLQVSLDKAIADPKVRVIILNANGKNFSVGADINWMQRMVHLNEEANYQDALCLGTLLHTLYYCPKPTIAVIQGSAFGGGIGLIAACDFAIASHAAQFCFSEVKLGLIPSLISPYVVKAMGERLAKAFFMSAAVFDAKEAYRCNLVTLCVEEAELQLAAASFAQQILENAPEAVLACKQLVQFLGQKPIDAALVEETALRIARKRVSKEGQAGLNAFLNKEKPKWN